MEWVDRWSDLIEITRNRNISYFFLPDWRRVTIDDLKEWIQDRAYEGKKVELIEAVYKGKNP
jgi:hypothetical protein